MPMVPLEPPRTVGIPALNSDGFGLVSWNIYKGQKKGWAEDFQRLSRHADILILQEAYLSGTLKKLLGQQEYNWDMTVAFKYRQVEAGVLTATNGMFLSKLW